MTDEVGREPARDPQDLDLRRLVSGTFLGSIFVRGNEKK
jgi:hypothetical protein